MSENDGVALRVPLSDSRFLADAIKRILREEDLRLRMPAAARERASSFTRGERGRRLVEFAGRRFDGSSAA